MSVKQTYICDSCGKEQPLISQTSFIDHSNDVHIEVWLCNDCNLKVLEIITSQGTHINHGRVGVNSIKDGKISSYTVTPNKEVLK
jgi:C4-type Zn-finger protein